MANDTVALTPYTISRKRESNPQGIVTFYLERQNPNEDVFVDMEVELATAFEVGDRIAYDPLHRRWVHA